MLIIVIRISNKIRKSLFPRSVDASASIEILRQASSACIASVNHFAALILIRISELISTLTSIWFRVNVTPQHMCTRAQSRYILRLYTYVLTREVLREVLRNVSFSSTCTTHFAYYVLSKRKREKERAGWRLKWLRNSLAPNDVAEKTQERSPFRDRRTADK